MAVLPSFQHLSEVSLSGSLFEKGVSNCEEGIMFIGTPAQSIFGF